MQTFDQSLYLLYKNGLITLDEALRRATNPDEFKLKIQGIQSTSDISREEMEGALELGSEQGLDPFAEDSPFEFGNRPTEQRSRCANLHGLTRRSRLRFGCSARRDSLSRAELRRDAAAQGSRAEEIEAARRRGAAHRGYVDDEVVAARFVDGPGGAQGLGSAAAGWPS